MVSVYGLLYLECCRHLIAKWIVNEFMPVHCGAPEKFVFGAYILRFDQPSYVNVNQISFGYFTTLFTSIKQSQPIREQQDRTDSSANWHFTRYLEQFVTHRACFIQVRPSGLGSGSPSVVWIEALGIGRLFSTRAESARFSCYGQSGLSASTSTVDRLDLCNLASP